MSNNLEQTIEKARENAREVCDINGVTSKECAAEQDALEELRAEAAHQRDVKPKNSLERFCDENPEASECLVYDN
jgi:CP12 domain